jgi:hypothetical protein
MSGANTLEFEPLRQDIHTALRAWRQLGTNAPDLLGYLQLVGTQRQTLLPDSPPALRLATNRVLLHALRMLEKQDEIAAQIIQRHFLDGQTILWVSHTLGLTPDEVKKRQRRGVEQLTHIILEQETAARHDRIHFLESALDPPTYATLFGVDAIHQDLVAQLLAPAQPWGIALVGIGGIGKTALADSVTRAVLHHFHFQEVIWLRVASRAAPRTPAEANGDLPADLSDDILLFHLARRLYPHQPTATDLRQVALQIRQTLKATPHLIILDNLETDLTPQFLARLHDLANPSKFLLTTRIAPPHQPGICNVPLPALTAADVAQFVRQYGQTIGLPAIAQLPDEEIEAIYQIVGGNPLALKLVVNLADALPLAQIRADLTRANLHEVAALYRHIYWQTWQILSANARALLKVMPLVADMGGDPAQLAAISGLAEATLWPAVAELTRRSLLEIRGHTHSRRYAIHRLTDAFLQTEIIHWQPHA